LPAFHQWRSGAPGAAEAAHALLRDKVALADELGALKIPVVSTLACVAKGAPGDTLSARLPDPWSVFCKSRSGHGGFGAFTAWRTHAGLVGRCLDGRLLPDTAAVEDAWRGLLRRDDALIQPCLTNHPALAPLAEGDESITVRYISRWRGAERPRAVRRPCSGRCGGLIIPGGGGDGESIGDHAPQMVQQVSHAAFLVHVEFRLDTDTEVRDRKRCLQLLPDEARHLVEAKIVAGFDMHHQHLAIGLGGAQVRMLAHPAFG
jgi:hypothetical protein